MSHKLFMYYRLKGKNWLALVLLLLVNSVCCGIEAQSQTNLYENVLLPKPKQITFSNNFFIYNSKENPEAKFVYRKVKDIQEATNNKDEAYRLTVTSDSVIIESITDVGKVRAESTLSQLTKTKGNKKYIRCCNIVDWPSFRIRGFMQDCGRSYLSVETLLREIKIASAFKMNVFHWHLTENHAWRLESKIYPQLNEAKNMTRDQGKYYTQDEARKITNYCQQRGMTIIPEIDMPGHSAAFERAFGCDMQSEKGIEILKKLIDEVCQVFPDAPYLHIGTDEVKFTNPDFVPQMVAYIRSKGKKVISWNPGFNYKPGEIDMTQLWSWRGKAQKGIPAIDCRLHYLNHFDTFGDITALYLSRIYNQNEGSNDVAGSIIAIWNDRHLADDDAIERENSLYPNMLAIAERTWDGGGYEYFDDNGVVLPDISTKAFKDFKDFERRMLWWKDNDLMKGAPFSYVSQTQEHWMITDAFPNDGNLTKTFPPEKQLKRQYIYEGKTYNTREATGAGIYLRHVWGNLVPAFYKSPQENSTAYAYTYIWSDKTQRIGLMFETQNFSRSEDDIQPIQGQWDYRSSRLWINGKEVLPPVWHDSELSSTGEKMFGDENCVSRKPLPITLQKGWNKVLIKLPVGKFSTSETRLVKWMFTAAFVTLDGSHAAPGIVFSPNMNNKKK